MLTGAPVLPMSAAAVNMTVPALSAICMSARSEPLLRMEPAVVSIVIV